jgi:ABC-type lipoprotein export system ATPase subunit
VSELLRATRLAKTWDPGGPAPIRAVVDASLNVESGETIVVTGPSGSGKTTLLSMLGALLRPDHGEMWLDGVDLAAAPESTRQQTRLRKIGFVFQRGLLLEHLNARQNVALVLQAAGTGKADALAGAEELLERLGLGGRGELYPAALSPGERQRVAVARAVALTPKIVLADEPTAHLDTASGGQVVRELWALATGSGAGLVVVTHDPRVTEIADRVLRLEDGYLFSA